MLFQCYHFVFTPKKVYFYWTVIPSSSVLVLSQAETIITTMLTFGKIWHFPKLTYFFNLNKISFSPWSSSSSSSVKNWKFIKQNYVHTLWSVAAAAGFRQISCKKGKISSISSPTSKPSLKIGTASAGTLLAYLETTFQLNQTT